MGSSPLAEYPDLDRVPTRAWILTHNARPWLLNTERAGGKRGAGGHFGRAALVAEWREAFAVLAMKERVPPLTWIAVDALQVCKDRRMPDIGNCYPAVKAAVDGLVDAGIVPDDRAEFMRSLTFLPPRPLGYDALVLRVRGPVASQAERSRRAQLEAAKLARKARRAR